MTDSVRSCESERNSPTDDCIIFLFDRFCQELSELLNILLMLCSSSIIFSLVHRRCEKRKYKQEIISRMKLGEKQVLTVVKTVDFGVYLGSETERVLLPKKQVPSGIEVGDPIEVFLYKDSSDRIIATTREPKLTLGKLAVLEVADTNRMGAFLDWGLEKDLFLPFRQQTAKVKKGDRCLCTLYIDKSERLCATMKVYHVLRTDSPYQKDDRVQGIIYDTSEEFGVLCVDIVSARIPKKA